ncbi:transposase [Candidatus Peregrinibacteria bacterium]|nr:MAG: transposase [Candidatus Peregrinibacteria bacterium]
MSVKYEDIYLKQYESPLDTQQCLKEHFYFYNNERPHQSLDYETPVKVYQFLENMGRARARASQIYCVRRPERSDNAM